MNLNNQAQTTYVAKITELGTELNVVKLADTIAIQGYVPKETGYLFQQIILTPAAVTKLIPELRAVLKLF